MIAAVPAIRRLRRRAPSVWTLIMPFDQPDLLAASKPGVAVTDGGYGVIPTAVPGRFGDGAAVPPGMTIDWSAADGFADAAAAATEWTLEFWARSPSGSHAHWLRIPGWNCDNLASIGSTWTHVALSRTPTAGWLFVDGAQVVGGDANSPAPTYAFLNFYTPWDAQYDALRLTVGACLYSAPFTPPTTPPTAP